MSLNHLSHNWGPVHYISPPLLGLEARACIANCDIKHEQIVPHVGTFFLYGAMWLQVMTPILIAVCIFSLRVDLYRSTCWRVDAKSRIERRR